MGCFLATNKKSLLVVVHRNWNMQVMEKFSPYTLLFPYSPYFYLNTVTN